MWKWEKSAAEWMPQRNWSNVPFISSCCLNKIFLISFNHAIFRSTVWAWKKRKLSEFWIMNHHYIVWIEFHFSMLQLSEIFFHPKPPLNLKHSQSLKIDDPHYIQATQWKWWRHHYNTRSAGKSTFELVSCLSLKTSKGSDLPFEYLHTLLHTSALWI